MSGPLIIAVPSKGRLQENAAAFFARAGLPFVQNGAREYRARIGGLDDVEIALLSASEIVGEVAAGRVHLGITGLDLVHESVPEPAQRERLIHLVQPLGFGHADVVVAVPKAWIDVRAMADLADIAHDFRARHGRWLRVATKYIHLARAHFDAHGIVDYRIVESLGATEGAPAAGSAELIVDITTTGSTLAANALKIVEDGVILRSEAHLVAARTAEWSDQNLATVRAILDRILAEARARPFVRSAPASPMRPRPAGRRRRRSAAPPSSPRAANSSCIARRAGSTIASPGSRAGAPRRSPCSPPKRCSSRKIRSPTASPRRSREARRAARQPCRRPDGRGHPDRGPRAHREGG